MQQHPLPQNVMSIEFQLVGNLTLRQFAYLAVGGMIVFLIFLIPLTDFIKYPLIVILAAFFASLAWLPVNDIGLDRWLVAFFRAINSPTKRVWRREPKELLFLTSAYAGSLPQAASSPSQDRAKLDEYLATLRARAPKSDLDLAEEAYLASLPFEPLAPTPLIPPIAATLSPTPALAAIPQEILPPVIPEKRVVEEDLTKPALLAPAIKPVVTIHMPDKNIYVKKVSTTTVNRSLHPLTSLEGTVVLPVRGETRFELSEDLKQRLMPPDLTIPAPATPPAQPVAALLPQNQPATLPEPATAAVPLPAPLPPQENPTLIPVPNLQENPVATGAQLETIQKQLAAEAEITRQKLLEKSAAPAQPSIQAPVGPMEATPSSPASPENLALKPAAPAPLPTPPPVAPAPQVQKAPPAPVPAPVRKEAAPIPVATATPAIGKMAPPPANVPNVIVGLVRDQNGLLLVEVVIIVKDAEGEPVRALKTNKVGQFAISTPLPNGAYTISLEKDSFSFDTIAVNLNGEIFTPIEIKAQPLLTGAKSG